MALLITDPVVFKRKPNGDLKFPLEYARGLEAVAIGVRTRLGMCQGEWFLNLLRGIPYLPTNDGGVLERDAILGQQFDSVKVRAAILKEIMDVPGVLDVPMLRVKFDRQQRNLSVSWVVRSSFGDTAKDTLNLSIPAGIQLDT